LNRIKVQQTFVKLALNEKMQFVGSVKLLRLK